MVRLLCSIGYSISMKVIVVGSFSFMNDLGSVSGCSVVMLFIIISRLNRFELMMWFSIMLFCLWCVVVMVVVIFGSVVLMVIGSRLISNGD